MQHLKFKTEAAMTKWVKKTGIKFATNLPLNGDRDIENATTRGMVTATVGSTIFVFYPLR